MDLRSSVRNDIYICKEWNIQPSELRQLPYYQYEWILDDVLNEQKEAEKRQKQHEVESRMNMPKMPKTPKFSTPSLPKVNIPKFR